MLALPTRPARPAPSADPFAALNDEQRQAVFHGSAEAPPPLLIVAGAGSGKTTTLAARVARLMLDGADPQRILLLSFSRRAAQALQRRVGRLLHQALGLRAAQPAPELSWAGTFHGVAARLLREQAERIGLNPAFTISDRGDSEDLLGWVRQESGLAKTHKRFPLKATCLAIYSRAVNSQQPLAPLLAQHFPWCAPWEAELKRLFGAYAAEKQRQCVLDYDDLLLYALHMLAEPALARELGARFQHVLVDEYQDTNRLQARIVHALKPDGRGLAVVGDDAQSIYAFRAAEVRNMLDFQSQFEPPASVLTLQRNYRSSQPILRACNAVIALAPERFAKTLWSEREDGAAPQLVSVNDEAAQAGWVADQVLAQREAGVRLERQAVLFRTSHHSAALELELMRRDIPYTKYGGLKFLEAAHVKDLLSLLRWQQNPRHRLAGFRVAQLVQGMGPASARRLLDAMEAADDPASVRSGFKPPAGAAAPWGELLGCLQAMQSAPWPDLLQTALQWYLPQLQRLHEDAPVRRADLEQLQRLAGSWASREKFLAELTLDPPEATSEVVEPGLDEDYLILSTIHSAKGQEWSSVYVLNVVDGGIPSEMSAGSRDELEEERRLLYVAMTRAQHQLQLLVPQRFHVTQQAAHGDRHVWASLSRFIPPEVEGCFDKRCAAPPPEPPPAAARPAAGGFDLGARVRSIWD
ncbi:MAG TPA: ATP-dependent helicase [Rubrivivax sp.]|nr:ATP-dependent helicase [Rubrivivax sp.]